MLQQLDVAVPDTMGVVCNIGGETSSCSGMRSNAGEVARRALQFLDGEIRHNQRGLPERPVDLVVPSEFVEHGTLPIR